MFAPGELARLNSRKTKLLVESEAIRRQLQQDWTKLEPVVSWVEIGTGWIRRIQPCCLLAAPLFGLLAASKEHSASAWRKKLKTIWRLGRVVATAWKSFQADKT
jgi:hypothetical protein